jgi:hypothetical protein
MRRRSYQLVDLGERAARAADVARLQPGDSARVIAVRGSGEEAERCSIWLELVERMDDGTLIGKPELLARTLTEGAWDYRDRIRFRAQHVADVRTTNSIRRLMRSSFNDAKARVH